MNDIQNNILSRKRKRNRIKISNLNDFKDALIQEGYKVSGFYEDRFKEEIAKNFQVEKCVIESLYACIGESDITYKADNIEDLIDYIEKMIIFENEHKKLWEKISTITTLSIDRIEYERESSTQEDIEEMINSIEKTANEISGIMRKEDKIKLEELEKELDKEYIYAKDIELLKKMIRLKKEKVKETYNTKTKIKTISIDIPEKINYEYISAKKGTVEYHQYLSKSIPRMQRLSKNMNKYIEIDGKEKTKFKIDQGKALQDTINIAVAIYDNKEFRAISGSNEIANYCSAPQLNDAIFKSSKVNKLGKLGVGYDRVNDSEKKIFEEIHKQIEEKVLKNEGSLILYSKWEPCPSCYSVINQFRKRHPRIKVQVRYIKRYGG